MKKTLSFMVMAFALLFAQCRKPEVKFPTPSAADEGTTVSMTVTAGPGSKTDIITAGGITWSSGDRLYVGDGTKYVGYLTLVSGSGTPTGTFSGDVTLTGITDGEPTFHFFYLGSVDYTDSLKKGESTEVDVDFSSQNIYNNSGKLENASKYHVGYGSAKGTVTDGVVTGINVTLVSKVALAHFSFKKNSTDYTGELTLSGTNIYNKMKVNFSASGFDFTPVKYSNISLTGGHGERYVMLVPTGATTAQTLSFTGSAEDGTGDVPGLESNKFYGKTDAIAVTLIGPYLPGDFTVSSGVTVKFSKGNLQYLGQAEEGHKWRFAEHQWDIMGAGPSATSNKGNVDLGTEYEGKYNTGSGEPGPSETADDKAAARDLFGWGATGYKDTRTSTYQTNYQPYSTSRTEAASGTGAYSKNRYGYGPDYNTTTKYGLTVANKSDWGCVTGLPSAEGKTWRTLSSAEWAYLLNTDGSSGRTYANRFAKAKVNGVRGMLIFPDGYSGTASGDGIATVNNITVGYPADDIPAKTWTSMETAGVVFLPAAGYRRGSSFYDVGSYHGYYWSSACYTSVNAYRLDFNSSSVNPQSLSSRCDGYSVRLVR